MMNTWPSRTTVILLGLLLGTAAANAQIPVPADPSADSDPPGAAYRVEPAASACAARPPGERFSRALGLSFIGVGVPPEGDTPAEIAFTPDGSKIVIAHRDSQNLVVFDAASRQVLTTIPVTGSPNSLAITPDGAKAVTANIFEDTVSIIDLVNGVELSVLGVGDQPGIVRITPDGNTAIVGDTATSELSVVDIPTATEWQRIPEAEFWGSTSFGAWAIIYKFTDYKITLDNTTVIFPDLYNNRIQFFDIASGTVVSVPCSANPATIDMSPDGATAVIGHSYPECRVSVVDVASKTVTKTLPITASATSIPPIAINPSKTKAVYAIQNAIKVVNLITNAVSADIATGTPGQLLTTADGQYCVVGNYLGNIVSFASASIVATTLNTTTPDGLAASPTNARAATIHALRKEMMEVITTNGAASHLEGVVPTGPPPEGDKARNVAVTADASKAVVINNHSLNATVFDLPTHTIAAVVPTGERPGAVAINPAGTKAVVANLDSAFATIIDLATATATNVNISRRGSQAAISPDGTYAYIPVVADGDGVWRINIHTGSVVGAKLLTGNMGGIGFAFDQSSGIALSHDGLTLVTCNSFDNNISIINTATWTESKRLTVGTFPVRAVFSTDDTRIFVANKNSDTVSVVSNAGPGSAVLATISVGDEPWEMVLDYSSTHLYVANFNTPTISTVSVPTYSVIATTPLPQPSGAGQPVALALSMDESRLYVACNGADFHVISNGSHAIIETINTGLAPADMKFNLVRNNAYIATPFGADGLTIVHVVRPGDLNCDGSVNFDDINPFVLALADPAGYAAMYPDCTILNGDCDNSGAVTFDDINCFVDLLSGR